MGKIPLKLFPILLGSVVIIIMMLLSHISDTDDKIWYWWLDWHHSESDKRTAIWLPDYEAVIQGQQIPGIAINASGITFNPDTNTFWVIANSPQLVIEMDAQLLPLRKIALTNFTDTEAIAYAGNGNFVIADERDQTIAIAKIDASTQVIDRQTLPRITLDKGSQENKGIEGIAVNFTSKIIYIVKEKNPLKIMAVSGLLDKTMSIEVEEPIDIDNLYLSDLSGLHFDEQSGHLLVLSHESKLLAEIDLLGNKVSYMDLESGFSGLLNDIPQAEGITLDAKGKLYIISEPNLLYQFSKK